MQSKSSFFFFKDLLRLEKAIVRGKSERSWRTMSLARFLDVAAISYDASLDELKNLSPREKYERRADRRHGGMLDLSATDSRAFEHWFSSGRWHGCHPWEIVFAHPHGVLLAPHLDGRSWRFNLSVDTLGLYVDTVRMAIALGEASVPFELFRAAEIVAAIRGEDWVEIGPFYGQLSLEELESRRKGTSRRVEWDDFPNLKRLGPDARPSYDRLPTDEKRLKYTECRDQEAARDACRARQSTRRDIRLRR